MTDHKSHAKRLERNDKSRPKAEHNAEPWSQDEIDFLMIEFAQAKGCPADEGTVAECLGRTIEACRQRFYQERLRRAARRTP